MSLERPRSILTRIKEAFFKRARWEYLEKSYYTSANFSLTTIGHKTEFKHAHEAILRNQDIYREVERMTGVPWQVVAVIHYRESSNNFRKQLLNGEPFNRKTTLVPEGLGPWPSWRRSCVDAFKRQKMPLESSILGQWLDAIEAWNGYGYRRRDIMSPYLWAGTPFYTKGFFPFDGRFNKDKIDSRIGVVPLLQALNFENRRDIL